jgi:transcriptional regulator with GAF, ATPase, and Fis domain
MVKTLIEPSEPLTALDLKDDPIALLKQHQKLQDRYTALFKLNQLSTDCANLDTFFTQVHQSIASIMSANNFYIVLYDQTLATLELVYHVDEKDEMEKRIYPIDDFKGSMTTYVIDTGSALLATPEVIKQLEQEQKIKSVGTAGVDWLGVPLVHDGFVIGVMAVQSYSTGIRYQVSECDLLSFTAQHIVTALFRLQDRERLKLAVDARTRELMQQIRDREKSELLQESLYRISELTNDASIDIETFYNMVHNIIGQLINAENFYIAKYNSITDEIYFTYYLDQSPEHVIKAFEPRKLGKGLTELVLKSAETVLLDRAEILKLYQDNKVAKPQTQVVSWLGVPLIHSGEVLGAMGLQSYQK